MAAFSELLSRAKRAASNEKSFLNIGRQQYVQALEDTAAYYARKAGVPDGYTSTIPTPTPIPTPAVRSERKVPDASKDVLAAREAAQRLSYSLPAEAQASVGRQNSPMTGTELREAAANQEQIKKDLNTVDLYVNRGLTGTERLEKQEDLIRAAHEAAALEEQRRTAGLTGTERLVPLRELEQQRKNLEAEKTDMYDHPENYIWTEPLTGTERREKGYDYTNRFDYGTELAKRGAEYDSQIEKIDQQIAELRAINYEKLAYEPDFNKYVKIGAEMESEVWDNPDEGTHLGNVSAEIYEGSYTGFDLLTRDEQKIHNYLLGKYGKESAEQYFEFMRTTVNHRYGQRVARAIQNSAWKTGALIANSLGTGVTNWMAGALGAYGAVTGQKLPENSLNYASQYIKEDLGKAGQIAYDLGVTVGNMLPSVLVGGPVGIVMQGVSAGGNAYQQGLREGMTEGQAWAYGLAVGASEACLQRVMGGISRLGGVSDDVIKAVSGVENGILKFILKTGGSAIKEGSEEALQAVLEPIFKSIVTGDKLNIDWSEVAYDALLGTLTGGVFEAPGNATAVISDYASIGEKYDFDENRNKGWLGKLKVTAKEISDYVERALSRSRFVPNAIISDAKFDDLILADVTSELAHKVFADYGIDISGGQHILTDNNLRHIYNSHGPHTKEVDPVIAADLKMIPTVIDGAEDVYYVPRTDGKKGLVYEYRYGDNSTYYLEQILEGNKLINAQMIKTPRGVVPDLPGLAQAMQNKKGTNSAPGAVVGNATSPQMYVQDVWNGTINNIPQAKNKVNGKTGSEPSPFLYLGRLAEQAKKNGNLYTQRLLQRQIEKAMQNSHSADTEASTPMPTIYADYMREHNMLENYETSDGLNVDLENDANSDNIKMNDREVRKWYVENVAHIPDGIDHSLPFEKQARMAFEARNKLRTNARNMMENIEKKEKLDKERPNHTFEELVESKMKRKGMTREEAIKDIYTTATKTNKNVNNKFGLGGE